MRVGDIVRLSLRSLTASKLRSALTMLGIVIGITSVVLLTALGEGIHRFVIEEFTQFGTNLVAVTPGKATTFGLSGATISTVRPLSLADAGALEHLDHIVAVVPVIQGNARVEYGERHRRTNVLGVGSAVPAVWKMGVGSGRFLPPDDQRAARPFAVLGITLRDELFGNANPLGRRIRIGGDRYRIIGVMEEKGQMLGFDLDDAIYIPTGRALELFNRESLMEIDVLYEAGRAVEAVSAAIRRLLIARHGHEDFTIITQQQMLETLDSVLDILTLGVAALGSISLLVGAVGIVTIMTIALSERVAEIGLLRALGARQSDILALFLGEAMALSSAGGAAGVVTGIVLVQLLDVALPALPVQLAWSYIGLAFGLSLLIGLLAGVMPALRAAGLEPLEALRTE